MGYSTQVVLTLGVHVETAIHIRRKKKSELYIHTYIDKKYTLLYTPHVFVP